MDYLLQKSCTQAPQGESTETGSETPLVLTLALLYFEHFAHLPTERAEILKDALCFCLKGALGSMSDLGCPCVHLSQTDWADWFPSPQSLF